MHKTKISTLTIETLPASIRFILNQTERAGFEHFALFGGALRDLVWNNLYSDKRVIKDYDLRVLSNILEEEVANRMSSIFGVDFIIEPSLGTGKPRYIINVDGLEIDLSVRPLDCVLEKKYGTLGVVYERVLNADAALGSAAIGRDRIALATSDFMSDLSNKQLTLYSTEESGRLDAYTKRMCEKFPNFSLKPLAPKLSWHTVSEFHSYKRANTLDW